jgi:hypothetical protein
VALPRIINLRTVNTPDSSTPAAFTMFFIINQLQTLRFFTKLYSQSIAISRTFLLKATYRLKV